jgi:hypothetical protein
MKIRDIITEMTSAGGIAAVAQPMGPMISRSGPKKKKRKKTSESLDAPYPAEMKFGPYQVTGSATTQSGDQLNVIIFRHPPEFRPGPAGVRKKAETWEISFDRNESLDLTGAGDQQRILATVANVVTQFMDKVQPERVKFSAKAADGRGRRTLYRRMASMLAKKYGYTVRETDTTRDNAVADHYYILEKPKAQQGMEEGNKAQKGIPANATLAQLDQIRSSTTDPEKRKRAHWLANMRRGSKKK